MSNDLVVGNAERALILGDLSKLSEGQRVEYYREVCQSVGLNPLTKPFDYLQLNGKLVLYAKRDATDQLRKIHGVSITIADRQTVEGVHIVTARATDKSGRTDESTGAVSIAGLKGDALCNAVMKAETKSKRRVTLSICGLGMLDETELETIATPSRPQIEAPAPPAHLAAVTKQTPESWVEGQYNVLNTMETEFDLEQWERGASKARDKLRQTNPDLADKLKEHIVATARRIMGVGEEAA